MVLEPTLQGEKPTQGAELEQAVQEVVDEAAATAEGAVPPPLEGEAEPPSEEPPGPELPEAWEDHPTIKERLKAVDTDAYNRAKSHLTRSHTAAVQELEATHQDELARAHDRATASEVVRRFADTLGDLDLSDDGSLSAARKLLQSTDSWAKVFTGSQARDAQATLARAFTSDDRWTRDLTDETADEFRASVSELSSKLRSRVARAESSEEVTKAYTETLGAYLEARDKIRDAVVIAAAIEKEKTRLEDLARKAAGVPRGGSPPAKPPGGATPTISNDYQKRLDRLSLGVDSDGNKPTDADREWLAKRE